MMEHKSVVRTMWPAIVMMFAIVAVGRGQAPAGLVFRGENIVAGTENGWFATATHLYSYSPTGIDFPIGEDFLHDHGTFIKAVCSKTNVFYGVLILGADGRVFVGNHLGSNVNDPDTSIEIGKIGSPGSESWEKVIGDAIYVLSTLHTYVSRDTGKTWEVDSAGLNGSSIYDITLDTAQNVWAASSKGIFWQNRDTSAWHQVSTAPAGTYEAIHADVKNNIFAAYYPNYSGQGVYISTDGGSTWNQDSAGMGGIQILKLRSDSAGNAYAIGGSGALLYVRANNIPGWTEIGAPLRALSADPNNTGIINDVFGIGTQLYVATSFGLFLSINGGSTWSSDNAEIPAEDFFSFAKSSSGIWLAGTSLGIYSKNPADTIAAKSYPSSGYLGGLPISADGAGNLYTLWGGLNNRAANVYKSTDNGVSWNPDTVGLTQLPASYWFVDELGGQHLATSQYGNSFNTLVFTKPAGGSWSLDTAGFTSTNYSSTSSVSSDKHGYLYISGSYFNISNAQVNARVLRRPIGGGAWVADTTGLPSTVHYFSAMGPDKDGNMLGISGSSLYRRVAAVWSVVPKPSVASSYSPRRFSVDSSGALFVSFTNYAGDRGVYFTEDSGATWTYAGLDSITVNQLISYGDSTFACTNDGLYILQHQAAGTSSVQKVDMQPATYQLFQNYPNPFNPTTTIKFSTAKSSIVDLKVYDLLGREVKALVHGEMNAGMHEVSFDASKLASGVYFYRLKARPVDGTQAGNFVATRKLVLLK